jgi:hypothetical protein
VVSNPGDIAEYARDILNSALITGQRPWSSPVLCAIIIWDGGRKNWLKKQSGFKGMPLLYFTQLLALALGLGPRVCHFELNHGSPESPENLLSQSRSLQPIEGHK